MEDFLKQLREILEINNYSDIDETIEYFRELILDSIENGQSEQEVIESLGSAKDVAYSIIGDKKIRIDEACAKTINVETIRGDVNIKNYEGDEIKVECDKNRFEVSNDNDYLYIKEIKRTFAFSFRSESNKEDVINIYVPVDYKLDKTRITTVSGDVDIKGKFNTNELKLKTVSGDVELDKLECNDVSINTVSGDVNLDDIFTININCQTVSGDIESDNVRSESLNVKTVSGDIDIDTNAKQINLDSKSGDINVSIDGQEGDYHVQTKERADKKIAPNSLTINTTSGDIDYSFKD